MAVKNPKPDDQEPQDALQPDPEVVRPFDHEVRDPYDDDETLRDPWGGEDYTPPEPQPEEEEGAEVATAEDPAPRRARRATKR